MSQYHFMTVAAHEAGHMMPIHHSSAGLMASTLAAGATHTVTPSECAVVTLNSVFN